MIKIRTGRGRIKEDQPVQRNHDYWPKGKGKRRKSLSLFKATQNFILEIERLKVYFDQTLVVKDISIKIPDQTIVAIMGPSGCGKSTVIRAINRMHDLTPNARVEGEILLKGMRVLQEEAMKVRKRIGMVFQKPNPFVTMSIYENVASGYMLTGERISKSKKNEIVETSLRKAFLWDEVKDRLHSKGSFLSGGQQQRLCIARSLALKVDLLLLDEPTSALDPIATLKIEELIEELKKEIPIVMVTHNTAQASRISDYTAFMYLGELVEYNKTKKMFTVPDDPRTEEYLMGKFG